MGIGEGIPASGNCLARASGMSAGQRIVSYSIGSELQKTRLVISYREWIPRPSCRVRTQSDTCKTRHRHPMQTYRSEGRALALKCALSLSYLNHRKAPGRTIEPLKHGVVEPFHRNGLDAARETISGVNLIMARTTSTLADISNVRERYSECYPDRRRAGMTGWSDIANSI